MEKIPHFYKALTKGVFLFDTLIKSKFYFFETFDFFRLLKNLSSLRPYCLNQIGLMHKTRTGQLANAQEERVCLQQAAIAKHGPH